MRSSRRPAWQFRIATLTIAWFGIGGPPLVAHEGDEAHEHLPPAADLKEVYKPTVLPDRIILTWAGDPAFTQAVTWRTSTEVAKGWAEIAVADADPKFAKGGMKFAAASQALLTCYTFVYQGARIIGLNSNEQIEQQAAWVDRVLAENDHLWVVCTFHHPIFSTGKDRDNPGLRAAWKPIFDKYQVDLVLQGHDHTYGRTGLATPVVPAPATPETVGNVPAGINKFDEQTGTVYVVSVSGPKMYKLQRQPFMPRQAENTQLYQIIQIDGGTLRYEARTAVGEIYDAFTLIKRPGEINELIEQIPDTHD